LEFQNQQKERRPHLLAKPLHKNHRWQTWRRTSQRTCWRWRRRNPVHPATHHWKL